MYEVRDVNGKLLSETAVESLAIERLAIIPFAHTVVERGDIWRLVKVKEDGHEAVQPQEIKAPY